MSLEPLEIETDVLVVGGGLAGTWAAAAAAREGARVVLVDKGYCGTSGVTAAAGPGHWWVPPDQREDAARKRFESSGRIGDERWMRRIMALTWEMLPTLERYYTFSRDDRGAIQYRALRGPEYLAAMRALVTDLGVTILDHSPALELVADSDGAVAGAAGIRRQDGMRTWTVHAGGTVLATGGCAFLSRLLGAHTNTGDGYLMGAEAGADLSGMEFNTYYTVAPAHTTMTRSMVYAFARYFDADGHELDIPAGPDPSLELARAMIAGPVYAMLDRFPERFRAILPSVQPNTQLVFDRLGIDPYRERFEVTMHGEGTVRGIGGLRVVSEDCATSADGLFACGDAASRELVAGATSGGGAVNSAWALSSGHFAGRGAAAWAAGRRTRQRGSVPLGRAGLRPAGAEKQIDTREAIGVAQAHMLDYDRAFLRSGAKLDHSRGALESAWTEVDAHLNGTGLDRLRARETAAMLATARWCVASGLARTESRGMHRRQDCPATDAAQEHRLRVGGLERVWTAAEPSPARQQERVHDRAGL